ncbi:MAG TPA: HAMP domain-containing sensor histidine kinase [Longimicrobiaceae bacterium]|nr:HAMP domain-containing sensor histidine kinase [Longimicrobiaceae bacterium]
MHLLLAQQPEPVPDLQLLFIVNVVVVVSVVLFASGVIIALLRRSYQRRVEEEKLAAMGTATARILHQIKNPLQTIVLHADLLQDHAIVADAGSRREVCEAIVGESQRLVAMLNELSVYASGSRRALAHDPLPVHQLVRQVARQKEREVEDRGILLDTSAVSEATILGDSYYLRQALENLIRNACEAMEGRPGARLRLEVERAGSVVVLRVADNGPGIPPERLETIFQPFVSTKGKGMGLGLSICKEIVEGHGGRIEVESEAGAGTVFALLFPLYEEPAVPAHAGH